MLRQGGSLNPVGWHDVEPRLREALEAAGGADPLSVRFLVSAHASNEELFVLKELVDGLHGPRGRRRGHGVVDAHDKPQPPGTKFVVPATDAPNVNGARDLGFAVGAGNGSAPDLSALQRAVDAGQVGCSM